MDLAPFRTLPLPLLHQAILSHQNPNLLLHLVVFVSSEDFEDSEVAQAVAVQLAAVLGVLGVALAAGVATPEVASPFLQEFAH